MGKKLSETKKHSIRVTIEKETKEKIIELIKETEHDGIQVAVQSYSPELAEILSKYISVDWQDYKERFYVRIHHRRGTMSLSRLIMLYKTHFSEYRNRKNAVADFIEDIPSLEKYHEGFDAAHIIPQTWNNCDQNLTWMESPTNKAMSEYIDHFMNGYSAFAMLSDDGCILVEFNSITGKTYIKCDVPEEYANFQKIALGKTRTTEKLTSIGGQPMPQVVYDKDDQKKSIYSEKEFGEYVAKRNKLLSLYHEQPEMFKHLRTEELLLSSGEENLVNIVADTVQIFIPQIKIAKDADIYVTIQPIK